MQKYHSESSPLFSILIANYNNGKYIKETIDSVFAQDYINWEIIIVDDASTDNSREVYAEYGTDSRIHIYYNEENKGVTYTKWRCIEQANGELCGFLDPDDIILPNAISLMVDAHSLDENISIVSSRYYVCDENMHIKSESGYLRIPDGESYLTYMQYAPWPFISFKMCKYRQTKGLNKNNKIGDDQELCLLLEEVGKWFVLDDITYKYRIKSSGLSINRCYQCEYWNIIVWHEACMRRGLNPEEYSFKRFKYRVDSAYMTKDYILGNKILAPLRWIKKIGLEIKSYVNLHKK